MIGHAAKDERGKYSAGVAGDQTKSEVYMRTWYKRPWSHVIRFKDAAMREKLAVCIENACKNDLIGYDQFQRNTLLTIVEKLGYDTSKVTTKCETDCSALISVGAMYAGVPKDKLFIGGNSATTATLRKRLVATGLVDVLTNSKYLTSDKYLLRGDILLYEGHHVAANLTDGSEIKKPAESTSETNPHIMPSIIVTSEAVASAKKYKSKKIQYMSKGVGVKWVQFQLRKVSEEIKQLIDNSGGVDGFCGDDTATAIELAQKFFGIQADKVCGAETRSYLAKL